MPKVLIVDDDNDLVQLLSVALKAAGYDVASAGEPSAGLQAARAAKPDIILLDYHMPGDTGAHLYEAFRRNQGTARTPILFMSGEASPDQILSEIVEAGNSRFLSKPVHLADLQRVMQEMLDAAPKP